MVQKYSNSVKPNFTHVNPVIDNPAFWSTTAEYVDLGFENCVFKVLDKNN